jgi:hypothetical protein
MEICVKKKSKYWAVLEMVQSICNALTHHSRNSINTGQQCNIFPRPARPQEAWAEQIPPSLLARTFPIPYATFRNGALSDRALVTLGRNDSVVGRQGLESPHNFLKRPGNTETLSSGRGKSLVKIKSKSKTRTRQNSRPFTYIFIIQGAYCSAATCRRTRLTNHLDVPRYSTTRAAC